jgi:hypothetical protein
MPPSFLWAGLLPVCGLAAWLVLRRPIRTVLESRDVGFAREQFRRQREYLEARFLSAMARHDPVERLRWEDAVWLDEVIWARDRQSRRLLALIGVRFENEGYSDDPDEEPARNATALFVFKDGRWHADGHHLDALQPIEAVMRHRHLEPIVVPQRRS